MTFRTMALFLMLAGAAMPGASALPPQIAEDDEKLVLENDIIRVWFENKTPALRILPAEAPDEANASGAYAYRFARLVEYNDLDGNGAPGDREVLASADLAGAPMWNLTRSEGEDNVSLAFALLAPVHPAGVALPIENVTLPTPARLANVTLRFTLGAERGLAQELIVASWPYVNANLTRLALVLEVDGGLLTNGTDTSVLVNGTRVGALSWAQNATGTTSDGAALDVPVRAVATGDDGAATLALTYDAADVATLAHAGAAATLPSPEALAQQQSASASERNTVPGAGLVAVAAGAAVALASRRRG